MEYSKLCPKCGRKQVYISKKNLNQSIRLNRQCKNILERNG